jgi:predicted transcriptional regulator
MERPTRRSRKRSAAKSVAEHGIFTDELPPPDGIKFQSEKDFFKEAGRDLRALRSGRRSTPVATVSFASVPALLSVLTLKRFELIQVVKKHGRFDSIEMLAATLGRDRASVSRDLKALAEAGLLRVQEVVHSGHGRRSEIAPVAKRLVVELTI